METHKFDLDYINFQATAQELRKIAKELGVKNSSKYKKEILQAMSAEKLSENMEKEIEEGMTRQFNNQIQSSNNVEPKTNNVMETQVKEPKQAKSGKKTAKKGIVSSIVEMIEKSGENGISKRQIMAKLVKKFPDRSEQAMQRTVNTQVPTRIRKERFNLEKTEGGKFRKV